MITSLIMDGLLKIVNVRKDSNKDNRVAQVFNPREAVPETVLKEVEPNIFKDFANNELFKLTDTGMVKMVGF